MEVEDSEEASLVKKPRSFFKRPTKALADSDSEPEQPEPSSSPREKSLGATHTTEAAAVAVVEKKVASVAPLEAEIFERDPSLLPTFDSEDEIPAQEEEEPPVRRRKMLVTHSKKVELDILKDEPRPRLAGGSVHFDDSDDQQEYGGVDEEKLILARIRRQNEEKERMEEEKKKKKKSLRSLERERLELQKESERLMRENRMSLAIKPVAKKNLASLLDVLKSKTEVPIRPPSPPAVLASDASVEWTETTQMQPITIVPASAAAADTPPPPKRTPSASIPEELIKKAPVLGLLDAEDIIEKNPETHLKLVLPKQAKVAPPQKVPFVFTKVSASRKDLFESMTLQCLEHRAKQRKELESQLEDLPAPPEADLEVTDQGNEVGEEEEKEDGEESAEDEDEEEAKEDSEGKEDGEGDANTTDANEAEGDDEVSGSDREDEGEGAIGTNNPSSSSEKEVANQEMLVPTQIIEDNSGAPVLLSTQATTVAPSEPPKKSNAFVDGEAEESDLEQGFAESGDESDGEETLKDQKMIARDDEELGGVDFDHHQVFQKQELEEDEKAVKAVLARKFKRGRGNILDDFDEQFEFRRRKKRAEDENLSLKPDADGQRPDMDLSEGSDTESTLIESIKKRTILREMEHRQLSDHSQSQLLQAIMSEESNIAISSSRSTLSHISRTTSKDHTSSTSTAASAGFAGLFAGDQPSSVKKQPFLLGKTDSSTRLNRLGAMLLGEDKGAGSTGKKGRFVFSVEKKSTSNDSLVGKQRSRSDEVTTAPKKIFLPPSMKRSSTTVPAGSSSSASSKGFSLFDALSKDGVVELE